MIFLIIWVLISIVGLFFSSEHYDKKFDELQQLKRIKAYKYGFFILIAYFFIDSTIRNCGIEWCDHDDSFMLGAMICFIIMDIYMIATGSMLCPKEKVKSLFYIGLSVTILSIGLFILCVTDIFTEGIIQKNTLTQSFMQTVLSIMLIFVGILSIIYYFKLKKHEKEETK